MSIREKVNAIMKEAKPTINLENVEEIIEKGYLDSFELMVLITGLCEEFNIEIEIEEITPKNFNSLDAISAMIERIVNG